jgi:hypothetical protein
MSILQFVSNVCLPRKSVEPGRRVRARPKPRSDPRIEQRLNADMAALLEQDLANIEVGIYPLPADHDGSLLTLLDRSRLFFRDLPDVDERRKRTRRARC